MSGDIPTLTDLLAQANAVLNTHWLAPDEPWAPRCEQCSDGHCPALRRAEARVNVVWRMGQRQ